MIVLCMRCGESLRAGERCSCESARDERPLSHLEAVVATAAALGGVTEDTIRQAAHALRERAS